MHDWKEPAREISANWTQLRKALVSKKRSVIFHYLATEANQELRYPKTMKEEYVQLLSFPYLSSIWTS